MTAEENPLKTIPLAEFTESLGHTADWGRRRIKSHGLEHTRAGRSIRLTVAQAEAFIRSLAVNAAPDPKAYDDLLKGQTSRSRRTTRK